MVPAYVWRGYKGSKLGSVGGGRQTGGLLTLPLPFSPSAVREGPDLDGPGKEWLDREQLRMDSESLDEEES